MTPTLEKQQTTAQYNPNYMINSLNFELQQIQTKLLQIRTTFNNGSFLLAKRDFERLESLEMSLLKLQQKIDILRRQRSNHKEKTIYLRKKELTREISIGLTLLVQQLGNLTKEKFYKRMYICML